MYTISVIVPIFHGKQYMDGLVRQVEECREKISNEDQVELIFVNDDPNETILAEFSSQSIGITILPTDCNRGIHGARVRGLERSQGKYVLFLDQDDQIHPDYFMSQLSCIADHDGAVCQVIHEKKMFYNSVTPFQRMMNKEYMFANGSPIISPGQVLLCKEAIPAVWKTQIVKHNGADDFLLWLCMLAEGKTFALNNQVLFEHVVKYDNASLNSYNMMCSEEEVIHILQENHVFPDDDCILLEIMRKKMRKKMMDNLDKFRKMFYVLDDWTASEEKGNLIEKYLADRKIRYLAVYGYGPLGKRLIRELRGSSIHVNYVIDQNAAFLETDCPAYTLEDDLEEVDAVVISLVQGELAIAEAIKRKMSTKIFTMGEIVKEIAASTV